MVKLMLNPRNALGGRVQGRSGAAIAAAQFIPFITPVVSFGGITLTLDLIPGNAGTITVTGACVTDTKSTLRFISRDFGGGFDDTVNPLWPAGMNNDEIATEIARVVASIGDLLAISVGNEVQFNLTGAGLINVVTMDLRGLALGPNLLTNGDFLDGLTGWTLPDPNWSLDGQRLFSDGTQASGTIASNDFLPTPGSRYQLTYRAEQAVGAHSMAIGDAFTPTNNIDGIFQTIVQASNASAAGARGNSFWNGWFYWLHCKLV